MPRLILRRRVLYPAELRGHIWLWNIFIISRNFTTIILLYLFRNYKHDFAAPEISLLAFGFMHFYKKSISLAFYSQRLLLWVPMCAKSPCTSSLPFSYTVFDPFYTDPIHLFYTGSLLPSLSADHLWASGLRSFWWSCFLQTSGAADTSTAPSCWTL